jgi:hypothetical protein
MLQRAEHFRAVSTGQYGNSSAGIGVRARKRSALPSLSCTGDLDGDVILSREILPVHCPAKYLS